MLLLLVMHAHGEPRLSSTGVRDPRLAYLLDESWDATMAASPTWATQLGDHRFDHRLDDNSPRQRQRWLQASAGWLDRAERLTALDTTDALHRDVFVRQLRDGLAASKACDFPAWSLSARANALVFAADLGREQPLTSRRDVHAFVSRFRAVPHYLTVEIDNLRTGLSDGKVASRASVDKVLAMVEAELAAPPESQALLAVTRDPHEALAIGDREALMREVGGIVRGPLRTALLEYRGFLRDELLPAARGPGKEGVGFVPNGAACYAARARQETSTDRTPQDLHQTGLTALEHIHAEMVRLGGSTLGTRTLPELLERLRTDPALHFKTRDEVERTAAEALARAKAAMPRAFGRLPTSECTVQAIPDHEAPYTTIAYYWPAAADQRTPGIYFVNSYQPETRTRFDAEVLAWHEAIPGHHLQIALANEAGGLPAFRRYASFTVFVEGWALYSERLADELGLYSDDLQRIGMLGFDSWRAARLVVDTGIHDQGWSREEAEAFLLENTPLARNNIVNEVDRYITWPGQALGYKTGQLELMRIRAETEATLGARFDLRGFHDVVLGGGALPFDLVEARVKAWAATR